MIESLGGLGAALLIALESVLPPVPSEVILPLAGFTTSKSPLGLVQMILWCTAGSLVGAWVLYAVGALLGRRRTRRLIDRLPLVRLEDVDRAEEWFGKHAKSSVFFGRMVPVVRSLVSIPAGVTRMPPLLFTVLTAGGSLLWNGGLILAGYLLGENWHAVRPYVGGFSNLVLAALGLMVAVWVVKRLRASR
ncbi:DedA family protein [Sinomonas mesophila]|uniref:DedA family protein n=1 Tax=Sinomonas mesophila TaxID=1531955 RepID=UPI001FE254C4|nr:DedA family protein [Sinomonas mesophila]